MTARKLSKRQTQILEFVRAYAGEHGYPPSVREIGAACGLASPSTVHVHLKVLQDAGYIRRDPNKPRALEVVGMEHGGVAEATAQAVPATSAEVTSSAVSLPLVGRVAAGTPILAEQNIEDSLVLPTSIVGSASSFVLRVRGDSMIGAGIMNGDYIVVREQHEAHNGEIVVALIDDSATVKTFYREEGRVRLQPENPNLAPIYVTNPRILGRVTAVIRSL